MDNKFKKSKYAAIILASTMALSTVASVTPQAFGETPITAHAANNETGAEVKDLIKALDASTLIALGNGTDTYSTKVGEAASAYDALSAAEKKKVSNAKLLTAHKAVKDATDLVAAIKKMPKEDNEKFTATDAMYTSTTTNNVTTVDTVDATNAKGEVLKDKKTGATIKRAIDAAAGGVEDLANDLKDFKTEYDKIIKANKDTKTVLAKVYKQYQTSLKAATAQQTTIDARYKASSFTNAYTALTASGTYSTIESTLTVKKGKVKIDGDQYTIVTDTVKGYIVTAPDGSDVPVDNTDSEFKFKVINNDEYKDALEGDDVDDLTLSNADNSTLYDTYKITSTSGVIGLQKVKETITTTAAVPVLSLDSSMTTSAYKALKAGKTKYSDKQIELISGLTAEYKKLDSTAKKVITADQVAKMKEYEKALKTQQALEKKLVSEDAKGVTKKISALKYNADTDKYEESIKDARKAYKQLTNKYKKKVKKATVETLEAHEAAIEVIKDINDLNVVSLLDATGDSSDTTISDLKDEISAINSKTGSYNSLSKKAKGLVKNYKDIKAIEKLITTQETYLKNKTKVETFETALTALTTTETVRTINNQVKLGTGDAAKVYTISVDKATKNVKLTPATGDVVEVVDGTPNTTISGYTLTNTKGKLVITTTPTAANVIAVLDFKGVDLTKFLDSSTVKYTAEQKTSIKTALDAYNAANKDKNAKKYLNANDVTTVKQYQTALKQQEALEAKEETQAYADFTKAVGALKYSTDVVTSGDNANKSQYEVDVTKLLADYTTLTTKYTGAAKKLATTKTKLDNHDAASKVATTILALPDLDEVTVATVTDGTDEAPGARKAYDNLNTAQKALLSEGLKTLEAVEAKVTTLKNVASAKTSLEAAITVPSTKATDKKTLLAAVKAVDTTNKLLASLTESAIEITGSGSTATVKVKLTSADADVVTLSITRDYTAEVLAAVNGKSVTVAKGTGANDAAKLAATKENIIAELQKLDAVKAMDATGKGIVKAENLEYTADATTATLTVKAETDSGAGDAVIATIKVTLTNQAQTFTATTGDVAATVDTEVTTWASGITNLPADATVTGPDYTPTEAGTVEKTVTITFADGSTKEVKVKVVTED